MHVKTLLNSQQHPLFRFTSKVIKLFSLCHNSLLRTTDINLLKLSSRLPTAVSEIICNLGYNSMRSTTQFEQIAVGCQLCVAVYCQQKETLNIWYGHVQIPKNYSKI